MSPGEKIQAFTMTYRTCSRAGGHCTVCRGEIPVKKVQQCLLRTPDIQYLSGGLKLKQNGVVRQRTSVLPCWRLLNST